jgi:hypothetical protein
MCVFFERICPIYIGKKKILAVASYVDVAIVWWLDCIESRFRSSAFYLYIVLK